jgi:SPP1 gp7 family putative phage head morphogenesis protein
MHWKRIDRRKIAWENVLAKRFKPLYEKEGLLVEKAFKAQSDLQVAIESMKDDWTKNLKAALFVIIEDFGKELGENIKSVKPSEKKYTFDPYSEAVLTWLTAHAAESIRSIQETDLMEVRSILERGVAEGLTNTQIAKELRKFYNENAIYKAMRVARTETAAAASYGQLSSAEQTGVLKTKIWLSSRDARVRDSHAALDGESRQLNGVFSNGCTAPGIGGDASEVINCRCVMQFE